MLPSLLLNAWLVAVVVVAVEESKPVLFSLDCSSCSWPCCCCSGVERIQEIASSSCCCSYALLLLLLLLVVAVVVAVAVVEGAKTRAPRPCLVPILPLVLDTRNPIPYPCRCCCPSSVSLLLSLFSFFSLQEY